MQGTAIHDRALVSMLLEAADLAYAAYKINPQSACAVSHLRVSGAVRGSNNLQTLLAELHQKVLGLQPWSGGHCMHVDPGLGPFV